MSGYVDETKRRWDDFKKTHEEVAGRIETLVMKVCECMTGAERKKQVEAMLNSNSIDELRDITIRYDEALGIRDHTDRELALWIRTICFCQMQEA